METLAGTVETITFSNKENGYTVFKVRDDAGTQHTCVGSLSTLSRGENLNLTGAWQLHPRFGRQFAVTGSTPVRPHGTKAILRLLQSGFIPHVGPTRAQRIVDHFGDDTLDIIDNNPERLAEVDGLGPATCRKIITAWVAVRARRSLSLFLQDAGISLALAGKLHDRYGADAQSVLNANPYLLIDDVYGIGFKRADELAQKLGLAAESVERITAGIVYALNQGATNGHCYLPVNECVDTGTEILGVPREKIVYALDECVRQRTVIVEESRVYLPRWYYAELTVARILTDRVSETKKNPVVSPEEFDRWLDHFLHTGGLKASADQRSAGHMMIAEHTSILTGGPGTGKTTTLNSIVAFFLSRKQTVACAAPTGRAAQRLGSVSRAPATTIHRLLEYRPKKSGFFFARNKNNPLEADVVIVDEFSMVDITLFRSLLEALRPSTRLILVGDSNQLPSVGPGNCLADAIDSGVIPHVRLNTIFRQAAQSTIVTSAHEIISGTIPRFTNAPDDNCFFLTVSSPQECFEKTVEMVTHRLPNKYGVDPLEDIQVLTPMHRGIIGTRSLNARLQQSLNPSSTGLVRGEITFAPGDRVMQIKNNYDKEVFNGDIGRIHSCTNETLSVSFNGERVTYSTLELDHLVHAFAISIHKSQGCEFPAVVIPLMTQHFIMLQRNLVYTALTRARKLCVFIGTQKALTLAVANDGGIARYSRLNNRLAAHGSTAIAEKHPGGQTPHR